MSWEHGAQLGPALSSGPSAGRAPGHTWSTLRHESQLLQDAPFSSGGSATDGRANKAFLILMVLLDKQLLFD